MDGWSARRDGVQGWVDGMWSIPRAWVTSNLVSSMNYPSPSPLPSTSNPGTLMVGLLERLPQPSPSRLYRGDEGKHCMPWQQLIFTRRCSAGGWHTSILR